jgi:hypothetical protein
MNFNIITPLARFKNFEKLKMSLKKHNVVWHIIIDEGSNFEINEKENWIKLYICPNNGVDFWVRCNNAVNWFIDNHLQNHNEYYGILNDDDSYEDNFFKKINDLINNEKNPELLIVSMLRGHNTPKDAIPIRKHPTTTLLAESKNMRVGGVGVEQFFLKGELLKKHKLPLTPSGDGELIVELVNNYKPFYLPNCFVLFNYFEEGRWNH